MTSISQENNSCQCDCPSGLLSPAGGLIIYRLTARDLCSAPNRPLLRAVNRETNEIVIFRPLCKSWGCPYCAPRRATAWQICAVHGVEVLTESGAKMDFVTVTSHEKLDAVRSQAVLSHAWHTLSRRVSRAAAGENVEYFAVPEQHKNGRWHLHAVVSVHLKRKWWKDNARACGFGYQSDVQEVKSLGGVGSYVTKYLTKSIENGNFQKGFRRVRLSHGWPRNPKMETPPAWTFASIPHQTDLAGLIDEYKQQGFTVVMADGTSSWDWLEHMSEGWVTCEGG